MKIYKTMRKRGLALFLALTMCLSLIQTTAFANEEAEHAHNEGGWTCAYTDPVTEPACAHEHDAACGYVEAAEEIPCVCTGTDEEGGAVHEDGCAYAPALEGAPCGHVCGDACVAVVTEGYWECTPPAGEPEDTEPTEDAEAPAGDAEVPEEDAEAESPEEVPAEVQAFLDAVAAIPEITAENAAEVAEYVYSPVSEAYDALLGTEYEERDDVMEAAEAYAAAIEAVDAALEMESENFTVTARPYREVFPSGVVGYNEGIVTGSEMGSSGDTFVFNTLPIRQISGGYYAGTYYPDAYYYELKGTSDSAGIISGISYSVGSWTGNTGYGMPCFQVNVDTNEGVSGTATVQVLLVYYIAELRGLTIQTGERLTGYFSRTMNCTITVTENTEKTYTVTYTDGVKGELVFTDQVHEGLKKGDKTPKFEEEEGKTETVNGVVQPIRNGYTFMGWMPEVNPFVSADDANDNGVITYTATWQKDNDGDTAKITGFAKKLVKSPNEVPSDLEVSGITYPNADGKVTIPEGGAVTLLYKITVTGDAGKAYKVTDEGAKWVGGDPMEGTIPESGSAVIYVTKRFTKTDINKDGKLVNSATVTPGKDDESSTSSTETTPAEEAETINYTVVYAASPSDTEVENLPASETKTGTAPGSVSFTVSSQVPTREGYTFAGWAVQGEVLKGGETLTVTASAAATSVTEYLYATWTKNPEKPEAPNPDNSKNGDDKLLRVKVVCDSHEKSERLRIRSAQNGVNEYTVGEVVQSEVTGYEWQCPVTVCTSDFKDRFDSGNGKQGAPHEYKEGTTDVTVMFYYKDGTWNCGESLRNLNSGVEIVYEKNGSDDYFCNYVVFHVVPKQQPPVQTPDPEITVEKINGGFKVDPQTGNAMVNYTVNITNNGDVNIYGLRLTDTLTADLTQENGSVTFTFKDWKVGDQEITPTSGGENELEHVLQLLPRDTVFEKGQTVTLTYTVEIENNSDDKVEVTLENMAEGASWSKAPANSAARTLSLRTVDDDAPDVTDSDSSSASTDNDAPDVTGSGSSTAGGSIGGSGTGGTLPAKYTVTYDWNLPEGADEELPASEKRPAGATITVDTTYSKDYEITVDGKTYVFSGWSTSDVTITDGKFTMPAKNVTITGTWTEREEQPPVDPLSVSAANVRVIYDGQGHPVIPTANKDGVQFSVVYKGANGVVGVPTDAGVYTAEITATLNGETASCTASVTITRRPLTVTTGSGSKYYDGTPLTNSTATVVVTGGEVPGEHITAVATGSRTVAGSSTNTYTMNWGSAKESNYTVTESLGTLTVLTRAPIIPPPPSGGGSTGGGNTGGGTTIPDTQTPLDPGTTIADQDVPLAAPGLNNTDHFDYIKGYVIDGQILVRPEANITRAEVATIFFRLMTKEFREANWATENDFTDVKKGDWYNNAISTCTRAGILKGYEDGTFKPNQTISREEFAAIAARFASEEVPAGGMFKDIAGRWSEKDIERAAAMGWIKGSNGLFRPVDKITRAEVIVIVNRMLDRVPDADHMLPDMKTFADNTPDMWWYADVQEATNSHEYDRAEDGVTGIWTSLLPEQDWAALEEEWATAADANVADVAPKLGTEGEKPEEGAKEPETAGGSDGNGEE